jgi:hypothetical protein
LEREEENAAHPGAAAAVGVEEESHQRTQNYRRWQRAARATVSARAQEEGEEEVLWA